MEITFKKPSLEVGFEAQKVYPTLEPLTVTPSEKKQVFNHPNSYGYDEVIVNEVQGEELSVIPTTEEQINEGVYIKVITKAIESEELNVMPSTENQVKEGMFNKVTVAGDENLIAENILKGKTIFGVEGTSQGLIQGAFKGKTNELKNTIKNASIEEFSVSGKSEQEKRTGKNLFKGVIESGLLLATNGTTYEKSDSYVCSRNYVDVRGLTEITVSSKNNLVGVYYILQYDKTTAYIGEQHSTYQTSFSAQLKENTAYVRVEMGNSANKPTVETLGDFQVEAGMTKTKYERYGIGPSVEYPCNLENIAGNIEIKVTNGLTETDVNYQEQTVIFPLGNQKLMEGSYLAEDEIHHIRRQRTVSGTTVTLEDARENGKYLCTVKEAGTLEGKTINFESEVTDVLIEYELAEEIIEPYSTQQQNAYNQLKILTTYSGITYVTTPHELKPILTGKYYMEPVEGNATIDGSLVKSNSSASDNYLIKKMITKLPNVLDVTKLESLAYLFYHCENVAEFPKMDTENNKNLKYAFAYCGSMIIAPELETKNTTNFERCFNNNMNMKKNYRYNTSKATNISYMYAFCSSLEEIFELDASNIIYVGGFCDSCMNLTLFKGLKNLGKAYVQKTVNYTNYRLNLNTCTKLTHDSLMNVINGLYDLNLTYDVANGGTLYTQSLVLGSTNIAKLTAEEIAIATSKRVDC